jgi:hypothetical protein
MRAWLLFVAFSAAAVAMADDDAPYAKSGGAGIRRAGLRYAQGFYPPLMKDPASTTFDSESVVCDHKFDANDPDTQSKVSVYMVKGIVRSKNSFGAVVPSKWMMLVVEREQSSEMAVAFLDDKIVAKTEIGSRIVEVIDKKAAQAEEAERQQRMAAIEEGKKQWEEKKARDAGREAGRTHGTKMGKKAKALSDSEIKRRARKHAADEGYTEQRLVDQFVEGYADAIAAAAQ